VTARRAGCSAVSLLGLVALAILAFLPAPALGPTGGWMKQAGLAPAYVELPGLRVRYVRAGHGPAVVLLHGFASSLYTWKDVLPALAAEHDVVALDLPGFGDSSIPRPLDAASFPGVVVAVMDRLGLARASLVGNSLGGAVAVAVAGTQPERVERLVVIDSAGFNFRASDRPWLLRFLASPGAAAGLERLPVRRRVVAAGLRQVFFHDELVTEERIDEYAAPLLRPGAASAAAELLGGRPMTDFPGLAARVRAPTLVVWGREDTWIPVAHAQRFADAIPGASVVIFEGCGHMPQEEAPADLATVLVSFLRPPAEVD
jgi:pimeloyl-ACP methyl ester carboxylesterase